MPGTRLTVAAALLGTALVASPALSAETITALFTQPDGGVTTGLYNGIVTVTVSGIGQSFGTQYNDAFYLLPEAVHSGSYYQLTFGTVPLIPFNPSQNAVNFVIGGLPVYQASHVYTFQLDTGLVAPGQLHFGVGDGQFDDNSGAYEITISAVPEPASWAMMIGGFAMVGAAVRRRASAPNAA